MISTGCPPTSQVTPSLGSGPIGVAPCWMYGASAPGDRRLVDAGERPLAGRENADLDRLAGPASGGLGGPAGVCRSPRVGGRGRRRGGVLASVAAAAAAGGDRSEGEDEGGEQEPQLAAAAPESVGHPIPPFLPSHVDETGAGHRVAVCTDVGRPALAPVRSLGRGRIPTFLAWLSIAVAGGRACPPPRCRLT